MPVPASNAAIYASKLCQEAAEWAARAHVQDWLADCLNQPLAPHDAAIVLPEGGLTRAHVYELIRRAEAKLLGGEDRPPFSTDVGAVLLCWLFHLCGGLGSKLLPPSVRRDNSWKRAAKLARERVALSNDMRKAEARRLGARTAHAAEQAEHDLQCCALRLQILYAADDLRALLAAGGKPTASVIATPPPGPPQPDPTTLQLDERRASLAWLLACGTHARGGRQCPFRVFADGHQDLLRYICNLAVAQNPKWVPRPQPSAMLQLSALVRKQQLELHAERAHSAQLQLEQDDALKEVERSARREASAHAHAAAERRLAQHEKDVFRVEHEVRCRV